MRRSTTSLRPRLTRSWPSGTSPLDRKPSLRVFVGAGGAGREEEEEEGDEDEKEEDEEEASSFWRSSSSTSAVACSLCWFCWL